MRVGVVPTVDRAVTRNHRTGPQHGERFSSQRYVEACTGTYFPSAERAPRRPDYRAGSYRRRVRAARRGERAARAAELRSVDAWAEFQRTRLGNDPRDVVSLQNLDLYISRALEPLAVSGRAVSLNERSVFG